MRGVDLGPCFYDWHNLCWCEICERDIVLRRESEDEAFAGYGLGL